MTRPVIWFLDISTNFLVRLLGGDPSQARDQVTDEELRGEIQRAARAAQYRAAGHPVSRAVCGAEQPG